MWPFKKKPVRESLEGFFDNWDVVRCTDKQIEFFRENSDGTKEKVAFLFSELGTIRTYFTGGKQYDQSSECHILYGADETTLKMIDKDARRVQRIYQRKNKERDAYDAEITHILLAEIARHNRGEMYPTSSLAANDSKVTPNPY